MYVQKEWADEQNWTYAPIHASYPTMRRFLWDVHGWTGGSGLTRGGGKLDVLTSRCGNMSVLLDYRCILKDSSRITHINKNRALQKSQELLEKAASCLFPRHRMGESNLSDSVTESWHDKIQSDHPASFPHLDHGRSCGSRIYLLVLPPPPLRWPLHDLHMSFAPLLTRNSFLPLGFCFSCWCCTKAMLKNPKSVFSLLFSRQLNDYTLLYEFKYSKNSSHW